MKLCVPIKNSRISTVISQLKKAQKQADIIEIWFDEITDLNEQNCAKIVAASSKPLIYKVSKFNAKKILELLNKNINYLDLDLSTPTPFIKNLKKTFPKLQIIISHHDFKRTPDQNSLQKISQAMIAKGADIIKIATTAKLPEDSLKMLSFLSHLNSQNKPAICLCMGKHGRLTRTAGHLFGNYLMYAPMCEAHETAPGQLTIYELKKILKSIN